MTDNKRLERDSLGEDYVPKEAYYGLQTVRSLENFPISGLRMPNRFVDAYIIIKKAAALANKDLDALPKEKAEAIVKAAEEVLAGKFRDEFVVDVFQMGAGTSFNMNCNEVLANRAIELLGGRRGNYGKVHPYNDVNRSQSTNDTFPTAMRISTLWMLKPLDLELGELRRSFEVKASEFKDVFKAARTHLQDAVPMTLGQEFAAYAVAVERCRRFIQAASRSLLEVGMGGTAAGTGVNAPRGYRQRVVSYLREYTNLDLNVAEDLREAMQSQRPFTEVSGGLRNLAVELIRIANDLRLLASGPDAGLGEITLPSVAAGSSIMPGKINPSMLEMVNMVCFQVMGNDTVIAAAAQAGQLELNVMMPVIAFNMLFSLQILTNSLRQLRTKCIVGIHANTERCYQYLQKTVSLATALTPYIGYEKSAEVVEEAKRTGKGIAEIVKEKKLLPKKTVDRILDPRRMTEPP